MRSTKNNTVVLSETDSTNNYANRLISTGKAVEGTVVLSSFQVSGRGQRGNRWESEAGKNLLASIIVFPKFLPVQRQFYLSKIISIAMVNWLSQHVDGVSVKWPNDIFVGKRKIAGILIETSVQGSSFHSAVIGVGLNLNQEKFSPELPNPVSLKQLTGKTYEPVTVAREIQQQFMEWYAKLQTGFYSGVDAAYHAHLFRMNEWSQFQKKGSVWEGRILGTGEFGNLIIESRSGEKSEFSFKEVEFIL
jgi:BirA family biotin operon repressor/biotin-[acetyl-CoA-carboxylase] ligase